MTPRAGMSGLSLNIAQFRLNKSFAFSFSSFLSLKYINKIITLKGNLSNIGLKRN